MTPLPVDTRLEQVEGTAAGLHLWGYNAGAPLQARTHPKAGAAGRIRGKWDRTWGAKVQPTFHDMSTVLTWLSPSQH